MLKTPEYPFSPLEGKRSPEGILETSEELKAKALRAMNVSLKPEMRCVGALEDWT